MGVQKTTYHIRNTPDFSNEHKEGDKRLVLLIDDVFNGLTIEKVMLVNAITESWLRLNGITKFNDFKLYNYEAF